MKKLLTIILLSISLSSFSQTEKGDFVITPTVGWNSVTIRNNSDRDYFQVQLPIEFQKYLSDRFAIGFLFYSDYYSDNPKVSNLFQYSVTRIGIRPEVRYNFLKTRFTPYITGRILDIGYVSSFYDNPATPVELRRITNLNLVTNWSVNLGLSYFIKNRFGLQLSLASVYNQTDGIKAQFNLPYNFGLQFIINNPRQ